MGRVGEKTTISDWSTVPLQSPPVINVLTTHAVSHERLVHNHRFCQPPFGHGLEPKIFWVRRSGQGLQRGRETRSSVNLDPDG
jgi:hypothetical protein